MNTIRNMHEVRFSEKHILLNIIYWKSNCFGNKSSKFFKGQLNPISVTYSQCIIITSKIKYTFFKDNVEKNFFELDFFIISD